MTDWGIIERVVAPNYRLVLTTKQVRTETSKSVTCELYYVDSEKSKCPVYALVKPMV